VYYINRNEHFLISSIILNIWLGVMIFIQLGPLGLTDINITLWVSFATFLIGSGLPDIDFFIGKHRGHMHSIMAIVIFGIGIFIFTWIFQIKFWIFPTISGTGAYLMHLILDELGNNIAKYGGKKTLKLW
jgi:membrane-bound metal-dependent hydrolase YbcI (DUF457 family)